MKVLFLLTDKPKYKEKTKMKRLKSQEIALVPRAESWTLMTALRLQVLFLWIDLTAWTIVFDALSVPSMQHESTYSPLIWPKTIVATEKCHHNQWKP